MKLRLEYKNGIINLPAAVTENLGGATKIDLALIILLSREPSLCENIDSKIAELAEKLSTDIGEIKASVAFWRGTGVLAADGTEKRRTPAPSRSIPPLSADDIERMSESEPDRLSILDACAQILGRMLNSSESSCVLALRDYLGVDDEYIILIAAYCAKKGKKSIKYIETTAVSIYDEGVETSSELESHLFRLESRDELESRLRRLIGAGERSFTQKEKERFGRWQDEYSFDFEMIELAYGKTVDATGKASVAYMDKILSSWHEKGFKTPSDVESDRKPQESSFEENDFFSMAVKRGIKG